MARKTFTKDEVAAFTPGTGVEWRNGSTWHCGVIISAPVRAEGWDMITVEHRGSRTATVARYDRLDLGPGRIRAR